MADWCNNTLEISGPVETMAIFMEKAVGFSPWRVPETDEEPEVLNFHNLIPIPPEVLAAGFDAAGYDWEEENWGCKWGACHAGIEEGSEGQISYFFDTAWMPPLRFIEKVSAAWPTLLFSLTYRGESTSFEGDATAQAGKLEDALG